MPPTTSHSSSPQILSRSSKLVEFMKLPMLGIDVLQIRTCFVYGCNLVTSVKLLNNKTPVAALFGRRLLCSDQKLLPSKGHRNPARAGAFAFFQPIFEPPLQQLKLSHLRGIALIPVYLIYIYMDQLSLACTQPEASRRTCLTPAGALVTSCDTGATRCGLGGTVGTPFIECKHEQSPRPH